MKNAMPQKTTHKIQLVGLMKDSKLIRLGMIFVKDKYAVSYVPATKGFSKLRWTWHQDGIVTCKNEDTTLMEHKKFPLDELQGSHQMLADAHPIDAPAFNSEYGNIQTAQIFCIDFSKYESSHFSISLHISNQANALKTAKLYAEMKSHQSFIYAKSDPVIVAQFFETR